MRLTPLDIRHKEFARAMRGYKDLEVDEFLDDIADEFERLFNENIDYKDRLETLEEKIEQYRNIEDTLKKTLVSAQQQAEEQKQNAQKESDLILRDAELKSRTIINDSYAERQKIQRSVSALKQKHEDLRFQLKSVIDSYAKILEQDGDYEINEPADLDIAAGAETDFATAETDFASLSETAAASAVEEEAPPGLEEAASRETFGEQAATKPETTQSGDGILAEEAVGEPKVDREAVRITPGEPAIRRSEDEDPFADVEIDTDDHKFKW